MQGRGDLERSLCELLATRAVELDGDVHRSAAPQHRTLDLVGYATRDHLLALGDWVIDGRHRRTRAMFRGLAEAGALARLGITRVRLVGCMTIGTDRARASAAELAEILDMPVVGTTELLRVDGDRIVACTLDGTRMLDLDALPRDANVARTHGSPSALDAGVTATAVPVIDDAHARAVLAAIRRDAGTALPGLLAVPHSSVVLPSGHRVDVLLDDAQVAIGDLVFPVADPRALRAALPV